MGLFDLVTNAIEGVAKTAINEAVTALISKDKTDG